MFLFFEIHDVSRRAVVFQFSYVILSYPVLFYRNRSIALTGAVGRSPTVTIFASVLYAAEL